MDRALFARVGWMKWYRGPQPDDERPIGGGSYNDREVGIESFNFLPYRGQMLGYFQPKLSPGHRSRIALERIEVDFHGTEIPGVLVIFIATQPAGRRQRVVGWYRNATVFREERSSNAPQRNQVPFFIRARAEIAVLVPVPLRTHEIPSGKGAFGQANVCYPLDGAGHRKAAQWIDEVIDYVHSYSLENIAQGPESGANHEIDELVEMAIEQGAEFQSNPEIRRAIEIHAMQ